jgi:hypothetical protein
MPASDPRSGASLTEARGERRLPIEDRRLTFRGRLMRLLIGWLPLSRSSIPALRKTG